MRGRARLGIAILALSGLIPDPCVATDLARIEALARRGKAEEALRKLDRTLTGQQDDLAGQFLRGVLLGQLQRTEEATRAFLILSQRYPERPEPKNNLAVLRAYNGETDEAIAALEEVVTRYPTYEIAASNLEKLRRGPPADVLSPDAPLLLTPQLGTYPRVDPPPPPSLDLARVESGKQGTESPPAPAPERSAERAVAAPAPPPQSEVAPRPMAAGDEMAPAPAPEASPREADAASSPQPSVPSLRTEITGVVEAWARAWSEQRVKEYLGFYATDFQPTGSPSREAWETLRRQRVSAPQFIEVEIDLDSMTIWPIGPDEAGVRFNQSYRSDRFSDRAEKTLGLVREDGVWRIRTETSL